MIKKIVIFTTTAILMSACGGTITENDNKTIEPPKMNNNGNGNSNVNDPVENLVDNTVLDSVVLPTNTSVIKPEEIKKTISTNNENTNYKSYETLANNVVINVSNHTPINIIPDNERIPEEIKNDYKETNFDAVKHTSIEAYLNEYEEILKKKDLSPEFKKARQGLKDLLKHLQLGTNQEHLFMDVRLAGKCLEIKDIEENKHVRFNDCTGVNNQRWALDTQDRLRPFSDPSYCLTFPGAGTQFDKIEKCSDKENQKWTMHSNPTRLQSVQNKNQCIDLYGHKDLKFGMYNCDKNNGKQQFNRDFLRIDSPLYTNTDVAPFLDKVVNYTAYIDERSLDDIAIYDGIGKEVIYKPKKQLSYPTEYVTHDDFNKKYNFLHETNGDSRIGNTPDLKGTLRGYVQYAQSHTATINGHSENFNLDVVPLRDMLIMFTPRDKNVKNISMEVAIKKIDGTIITEKYEMNTPKNGPTSDNPSKDKGDVQYNKDAFSYKIPYYLVHPRMKITFTADNKQSSSLKGSDFEFSSPAEGIYSFVKLGYLVETLPTLNWKHGMIVEPARYAADYFQTRPYSKFVNAMYEARELNVVILANGTIYDKSGARGDRQSSYPNAGAHSGDMREEVGKAAVSAAINLANRGVFSSPLNQDNQNHYDVHMMMAHFAQGKYVPNKNHPTGVVLHGLSAGNGIGTLEYSEGNEFSHEMGHGLNSGHWPFLDEAIKGNLPANGSIHGKYSSWGYDAYYNKLKSNFFWLRNKPSEWGWLDNKNVKIERAFEGKYGWLTDSMASGSQNGHSRYIHGVDRPARVIQKDYLEHRYVLSPVKNKYGEYYYMKWDKEKGYYTSDVDKNFLKNRPNPTDKGIPVITILGGYDPDNSDKVVLYPYFRGNYGHVFSQFFLKEIPDNTLNYIKVENGKENETFYVALANKRINGNIINKLHVNVPESFRPTKISLVVNDKIYSQVINPEIYKRKLPDPVIIGQEYGYNSLNLELGRQVSNIKSVNDIKDGVKQAVINLYINNALNEEFVKNNDALKIALDYVENNKKSMEDTIFVDGIYNELNSSDQTVKNAALEKIKKHFNIPADTSKIINNNAEIITVGGHCVGYDGTRKPVLKPLNNGCDQNNNSNKWVMDNIGRIHNGEHPNKCLYRSDDEHYDKVLWIGDCEVNNKRFSWTKVEGKKQYSNNEFTDECLGLRDEYVISAAHRCGIGDMMNKDYPINEDEYLSKASGKQIEIVLKYFKN